MISKRLPARDYVTPGRDSDCAATEGNSLLVASGGWSVGLARELSLGETFEELKKLCGEWKGTTAEGGAEKGRLVAGDTVLLEAWVLSSGREALTVYHRDGDDLIATHYCPRGNQPRLKSTSVSTERGSSSSFSPPRICLMPKLHISIASRFRSMARDSFARAETYISKGKLNPGTTTYSRTR
ncbi:MAG: hypothetical protein M3Q89_01485 [Verrucomicrobiota bacterium]|nr:hypothetical protein [Verrucomicrobiota bacterium]